MNPQVVTGSVHRIIDLVAPPTIPTFESFGAAALDRDIDVVRLPVPKLELNEPRELLVEIVKSAGQICAGARSDVRDGVNAIH